MALEPGRPIGLRPLAALELSAASGLVRQGSHVFVVADDEHFIDAYSLPEGQRVRRLRLQGRDALPDDPKERKRRKPDLEALVALPHGELLALGSGSAVGRCAGFRFDPVAVIAGCQTSAQPVDLAPLYDMLSSRIEALNIEGAAVIDGHLRLLQRGNGGTNAVVDLALDAVLSALQRGAPLEPASLAAIRPVALGELDGIPLAFTDASPMAPGDARLAFVAAAEDTDDPYLDGACAGSVLGVLGPEGRVEWMRRIADCHKMEGLAVAPGEPALLVADPDDRGRRATLFAADWPGA